jgi:uncharacterized protein (DUF4415 family)
MKRKHTSKSSVRKTLDAEIDRLRRKPDSDIDYSDIPETDAAFWAKASVSMPAPKAMISIRVDSDVLEWYRRHARRYQTLMNAVLRKYKEARELEETSRK